MSIFFLTMTLLTVRVLLSQQTRSDSGDKRSVAGRRRTVCGEPAGRAAGDRTSSTNKLPPAGRRPARDRPGGGCGKPPPFVRSAVKTLVEQMPRLDVGERLEERRLDPGVLRF